MRPAFATTLVVAQLALVACAAPAWREAAVVLADPAVPERPSACEELSPGTDLQQAVASLPEGSVVCLREGRYRAPLEIRKRVTIWGPRDAWFEASSQGTSITVLAQGTQLLGFTVDGAGGRYDMQDAAIAVRADDVTVQGVRIVNGVFGVLTDRVNRARILDNEIHGTGGPHIGLRGDAIRLWETRHSRIAGNVLIDSRDLVVWYSPHNRIERNLVRGGRYGAHFMYSDDNIARHNRFEGNVVGTFVMYSHDVAILDNDFSDCTAPGGMGVGIKDSGNVIVRDNRFVKSRAGVFVDNSPAQRGERNDVTRNRFYGNDAAIVFHGAAAGNFVSHNDLRSNREHVLVEGGTDARDASWQGNRFDDYVGYDFDDDGIGDVPYELRSLSNALASRTPSVSFYRGTLAFGVVDALGQIVPLFTPKTLLVDSAPSLLDPITETDHAR